MRKFRIRVKSKRFFAFLAAFILVLVLINIAVIKAVFFNKNNKKVDAQKISSVNAKETQSNIPIDTSGNIYLEQNSIFKKYTIKNIGNTANVKYSDDSNYIKIDFDKSVNFKLSSSNFNKNNAKGIALNKNNSSNEIKIDKSYINNNYVYIDGTAENSYITVLVTKVAKPFTKKAVLNAGHGGSDVGSSYGNLYEKNVTLKIVKMMVSNLAYSGVEPILTRDKDEGEALADIADFVNKNSPDVFLSVHINEFKQGPKENGIQIHYYTENGFQLEERKKFAETVLKNAVKDDGWNNRGVFNKDKLKVLRLSKYPCALIECGFTTNAGDREKLQNDQSLGRLASNLCDGIREYLNVK
ncbi:N-acetylmuramoyl-L-alanine amidase [Clostridium sp. 19966]|uniref:N-acetylmuramoyl-L-alanine amidase family protein n=1 Tax=Clostridium sp. 19966 TaxID=2768166 RepID=UPI0028DFC87E|nr:N-acetylmuramoyl-L-alanine amidase [Clostridium sp. 19966]MDT8719081.1 N-acetylmuramoyl-L-alanine amidase [Clostridium sp. 19966]